eukprot:357202-Chlamydomonas_euryale.AAC.23
MLACVLTLRLAAHRAIRRAASWPCVPAHVLRFHLLQQQPLSELTGGAGAQAWAVRICDSAAIAPMQEKTATPTAAAAVAAAPAGGSADAGPCTTASNVPDGFTVRSEGLANILYKGNDVFYNEAQVTNRDLSTAVLRHFLPLLAKERAAGKHKPKRDSAARRAKEAMQVEQRKREEQGQGDASTSAGPAAGAARQPCQGAWVLEGLAATGLRSIRYAKEIPGIARIVANDLDEGAVASMRRNVAFNGPEVEALIDCRCADARMVMMGSQNKFDAVDLDPYGTPSMFLDTAVQCVSEGGLMLVTATDMANLCGNNATACHSNYGSYPVHRTYCHEMAVRILLACIESHANRHRRHITPLLSLCVDFYVRVFVRIETSPATVKESPCKLAYLWQSSGCNSFWLQPVGSKKVMEDPAGKKPPNIKYMPGHGPAVPERCPDTGSGYLMGGPIWSGPIHDRSFLTGLMEDLDRDQERYKQYARIRGLVALAADELPDAPLYYDYHDLCKTARCAPMRLEVLRSALINAGYRVSASHANPLAVKTDAPPSVMWDIVRCWIRDNPVNLSKIANGSYLHNLVTKEPTLQADFTLVDAAKAPAKADGITRFVQNPSHWGPKSRHGRPPLTAPDAVAADAGKGGTKQQQQQRAAKRAREAAKGAGTDAHGDSDVRAGGDGSGGDAEDAVEANKMAKA